MFRNVLAAAALACVLATGAAAAGTEIPEGADSLDAVLQPYLDRYGMPALAAAVVKDGEIIAAGAVGTRRHGADVPVTVHDRFHLGSDTKAMTSLLAAMLVEEGKLGWDTTVGGMFPELAETMDAELKGVTLDQLLSHASGIPSDTEEDFRLMLAAQAQDDLNLDEARLWLVGQIAPRPLQSRPGEQFAYSNIGYVLAGAMIERVSGRSWEELIVERVFEPLGLDSAGLGAQSTLGRIDAPLGHAPQEDGPPKPMLAGPNGDNPLIVGPAGTAHMSVPDFAAWTAWNAGQGARGPALVEPETLQRLHTQLIATPANPDAAPGTPGASGGYGFGWGHLSQPFSTEPFVTHGGSNGRNLAQIALQPEHDFGMVLVTNLGGTAADAAIKALWEEIYDQYGPAR